MDETAYPASGVTVNVVVWPCVTTTVEGEIDPFVPAAAEMLNDGVTEATSEAELPLPPPQEINNRVMKAKQTVL